MRFALIDADGRVVAFSDGLESADDWSHPDNMHVVSAEGFAYDPSHNEFDYVYANGEFSLDHAGIAEREASRPYEPSEVLTAIFASQPEVLDALPDSALEHMASYMQEWQSGTVYSVGEKRSYGDRPYRCLQPHTSQQEWKPDISPSLWARIIASEDPDNPLPWEQPDSTNPYMKGDRVTHNGKTWESLIDYNVYEPGVAGWEEVTA